MPKSAAPPARSWGTFTSGPPWMIFTSKPRLAYKPFGQRLIEAAMLGLRFPVGDEADRGGGRGRACQRGDACRNQT